MTGEVSRDSIVPAFVVALRAAVAPLLPSVTVDLAYTGAADPGDYLWIHCEDPYASGPAPGSTSSQVWAGAARATGRQESGDITCAIEAWNGQGDVAAAMTAAYAILAPVATWLRTAEWSAVTPGLLHAAVTSQRLDLGLSGTDARALLVFVIHFEARI